MEFTLDTLKQLVKNKELDVGGAKLTCSDQVRPVMYMDGDDFIISFESPFIYVNIDTLGKVKIFDIKRKVDKLIIREKTMTVVIDDFPDIPKDL